MNRNRQSFDSVVDMVAAADAAHAKGLDCWPEEGPRWIGRPDDVRNWAQARAAALAPWQEGLDTIFGMLHALDSERSRIPPPVDVRRRKKWNPDDGDEVCLDRLRAGQDAWQGMTRQRVAQPRQVTIVANTATPFKRPSSEVMWRGAAAIALTDLLERAGYRVELWGARYSSELLAGFDDALTLVCLKRMAEPLDLPTLVNAVSGWFHRTIGFQAAHCFGPTVASNQGVRRTLTAALPEVAELARGSTAVCCDEIYSERAALAWVRSTITELES